jgi:hypothetical protein
MSESLHPDPDTLSGFAEGVLPEHERLECLAHFADCSACREVVYLAEEPLPVPVAGEVRWWKRWLGPIPILSAVAVAGILVLSVALAHLEKPMPQKPLAVVAVPPSAPFVAEEEPKAKVAVRRVPPVRAAIKAPAPVAVMAAPPPPPAPLPLPSATQASDAFMINGSVSSPLAGIAGTVTDPAGAVIPGAAVTMRAVSGAPDLHATTDNSGQFQIAGIPPGQYDLNVTRSGFLSTTKKVEVRKDQVVRADSSLLVGSTAEAVEVTASAAPLMATQSAEAFRPAGIPLPNNRPVVHTVIRGKVMLRVDSAGGVFRSDNSGKRWNAVKAVWRGKVMELADENGEFRLKTDAGATWLSKDGSRWRAAPAPQR